MFDTKKIGKKIRELRKIQGITQEGLAEITGLSTMSIRRYEAGQRMINEKNLLRIASALGVQIWDISPDNYTLESVKSDILESISFDKFMESIGYEFIPEYCYDGTLCDLLVDSKNQKLYIFPTNQESFEVLGNSVTEFADFSVQRMIKNGKEIEDNDGWFKQEGEIHPKKDLRDK